MSKDEEISLKSLELLLSNHIKEMEKADARMDKHITDSIKWRVQSDRKIEEAQVSIDKANELTTTSHGLITSELDKLISVVKSNSLDIDRYNKIETFVNNISKFSTWTFKFVLGVIAIGGAIWGAFVFIYNFIHK